MKFIRLNVPFAQKEQAKALGARWNFQEKFWYITEKEDPSNFSLWLQSNYVKFNIYSSTYFIAKARRRCWKCNQLSDVYALILPKTDPFAKEYAKILYYVTSLSVDVQKRFSALTSSYFFDYSEMMGFSYWMNHCQHCKARFGDFETIEEYTSPFKPHSISEVSKVVLFRIEDKLEAVGSQEKGVAFFALMEVKTDPLTQTKDTQGVKFPLSHKKTLVHSIQRILRNCSQWLSKY